MNLPVILLSKTPAKVSQGLAAEVAMPYTVLRESQRAKGVGLHATWLKQTVPAVVTETADVSQEERLEGCSETTSCCSSRISTMHWPKFRFVLQVDSILGRELGLECAKDGPTLPVDGVVVWDGV